MSASCKICFGAIPKDRHVVGHTALCAEIARADAYERGVKDGAMAERARIVADLRTTFRLNRNAQEFANDIEAERIPKPEPRDHVCMVNHASSGICSRGTKSCTVNHHPCKECDGRGYHPLDPAFDPTGEAGYANKCKACKGTGRAK